MESSADVAAVRRTLPERLEVEATGRYLQAVQKELAQGVDAIAVVLLVFAAIAFFVSAMVIANTFAILLAQRSREFALLRCVGATRRQVRRSVLAESTLLGVASATLGVLVGVVLGRVLVAVAGAAFPSWPSGAVEVSLPWVGGAWALGVAVTVLASLLPALRGTRVSPLEALRSDAPPDIRTAAGRWRVALAVLAVAGGGVLLAGSVSRHDVVLMLAGGMVSFLGVLLLGPVLVPAALRVVGLPLRAFGVPGRVAAANAGRNPRRTAATASSLLVGVTLISGLVTGMATVRASVDDELDAQYPLDATLTGTHGDLRPDTLRRVLAVPGVERAVALPGAEATVVVRGKEATTVPVVAVGPAAVAVLRSSAPFATPGPGTVYLPWSVLAGASLSDGQRVTLRVGRAAGSAGSAGSARRRRERPARAAARSSARCGCAGPTAPGTPGPSRPRR